MKKGKHAAEFVRFFCDGLEKWMAKFVRFFDIGEFWKDLFL